MKRNFTDLSEADAQDLRKDLDAYNSALRAQGHLGIWGSLGLYFVGRTLVRLVEDTFLYNLLLIVLILFFLNLVLTKFLPIKWRILKPTIKSKFVKKWNVKPFEARQILAEINGPDVLDGVVAANIQREEERKARRRQKGLVNKYRQSQLKRHEAEFVRKSAERS